MGTSGVSYTEDADSQYGLIPRFISDLFENLKQLQQRENISATIFVSFVKIYGDNIIDLCGTQTNTRALDVDQVLPLRESENGCVFVQGLQETQVCSVKDAIDILNSGTRNRKTESTVSTIH